MKKIWLLMLMVCTVIGTFTACSSDDDGDPTPQLPVSGVSIPATAEVGGEVIIRGRGFTASGISLYLENSSKEKTAIDAAFSNAGVTFTVPMSLVAGVYNVILTQSGNEWTLGSITLTDADSPIISPSLPEMVVNPGKEVTLGGSGYESGDKIVLKAENTSNIEISEVTISTDGLTFTLPADCPEGDYTVSLIRGTSSWVLDNVVLTVQKAKRVKELLVDAGKNMQLLLQINYDDKGRVNHVIVDDMEWDWAFQYEASVITTVSPISKAVLTYTIDDGKIIKSTDAMFDNYNNWAYTERDYLSSVVNEENDYEDYDGMNMTFTYNTDGNLEKLTMGSDIDIQYTYNEGSIATVTNTIDPALAIHLINLILTKEDVACAFLLNQIGMTSKKIPNSITMPIQKENGIEYRTYDLVVKMVDNVLSINCNEAVAELAGIANLTIIYEDIED
ncbi:hypothetical protein [Bacteroides finegoldii]|uniref:IPT/TIG domain-containing protein n=1 Tax=Bacteroides finegoldii TaxID=338188 RepID=A0A174FX49_9BACE|nr:hypothetical protein [Bacteroides finegoldii]CUO54017.1 Uncharacterised protein [Bacteroides finegoldii]